MSAVNLHPYQPRTALVLYGSETGNAQDVAEELGRLVQRLHFSTLVLALDAIAPDVLLKYPLVFIAVSTTGQGDLPANARLFWKKLLRKKLPHDYLAGVRFALFGLGDSSYPKFNWAALKLSKRLQQLGAVAVVTKGEGDEQHPEGIDSIFIPWAKTLRQELLESFPLENGQVPVSENVLLQPQWLLGDSSSAEITSPSYSTISKASSTAMDIDVTLESNERLTSSSHWQDIRHIKLQSQQSIDYAPGDILTIYPQNAKEDVDQLLLLMGWQSIADTQVIFKPNENFYGTRTAPIPTFAGVCNIEQMTLRYLLTNHLDLNAIPRRSFFALIQHFTNDEFQRTRLQEFTDPEYTDELFDYTTRPRRSTLEVLQEFDTLRIPWQWAASILPPLRGRQFSIASGGKLKHNASGKTRFELLVAIVKYRTVIRKIRRGVCTRYLESLPVGSQLRVLLVRGSLGISMNQGKFPIIMIGPGTGVAPMRSLIWERLYWQEIERHLASSEGNTPNELVELKGSNVLFFGCRNRQSDYLFADEWVQLQDKMPLSVVTAFSRDQQSKFYVQDAMLEKKELVFRLINDLRATVFVCGSSGKMPQAVREALIKIFQQGASSDREAAEAYLNTMEKTSRYKQETW